MAKLHKRNGLYRGRVKVAECGPNNWKWFTLFTDKTASEKRYRELQQKYDREMAGESSVDSDRLKLPIAALKQQYIEALREQKMEADHVRISEWMLGRLIDLGGWKFFRNIKPDSLRVVLGKLENKGDSVSYRNKFITRAKAFVHWLLPPGWIDPLKSFKRIPLRGSKGTRERRAGTDAELVQLFGVEMPEHRKVAYAFAAFNGLRRNEIDKLLSDDLHISAPIPFLGVRRKMGKDETLEFIPVHPYLVKLLDGWPLTPGATVMPSVPDMKTMAKDLVRAGIAHDVEKDGPGCVSVGTEKGQRRYIDISDARGRRLDFHPLRHTFQTNLDRSRCSRATKKRLMRHANEDVTDGYAHAELDEMRAALLRVQSPGVTVQVATGTDGKLLNAGTLMGHDGAILGHCSAQLGATAKKSGAKSNDFALAASPANGTTCHTEARSDLNKMAVAVKVSKPRPSTQVD